MMSKLAGIMPMVAVAIYISLGQSMGFTTGLMRPLTAALCAVLAVALWRPSRSGEVSPISATMAGYIALAALGWWLWPSGLGAWMGSWPASTLYLALLAMAVVPLALGRPPFTTWFARRSTPQAAWETSFFREINRNLTWLWATLFALNAVIASLPGLIPALGGLAAVLIFQVALPLSLLLGVGLPANIKYPGLYLAKRGVKLPTDEPAERPAEEGAVMAEKLKVVAVNGSPHVGIGNTDQMLEMIGEALNEQGAELTQLHLAECHLEYCMGCGLCMEKGKCWRMDDHQGIIAQVLEADALILASPVYFRHVTAQMKTFLDRSLSLGHKPRTSWKPGLAVAVSAGWGESEVAAYLSGVLKAYGAFSVGSLTAIAVGPGDFVGKEHVQTRARDLAADLVRAVREKRRMPATDLDLNFWLFMGYLVKKSADFMTDDDRHWREAGFYDSFEKYVGQELSVTQGTDPELRKAWIRQMIADEKERAAGRPAKPVRRQPPAAAPEAAGPQAARSCRELISMMPLAFKAAAAGDLAATIQFTVSGGEDFTAHLAIADGQCRFVEGPAAAPALTIETPADVWLGIAQGKLNGQQAFMTGKYRAQGDLTILMRLGQMFGG